MMTGTHGMRKPRRLFKINETNSSGWRVAIIETEGYFEDAVDEEERGDQAQSGESHDANVESLECCACIAAE